MTTRIALLSTLLLLSAGAALATPTAGEARPSVPGEFAAAWSFDSAASTTDRAFQLPTFEQGPVEVAVIGPCGCIPIPCPDPFPVPWPQPNPWPLPLPFPTCPCEPFPF